MSVAKLTVGKSGASEANVNYITREGATEAIGFHNLDNLQEETFLQTKDNALAYASISEEDELAINENGRTHYRLILSWDKKEDSEIACAEAKTFLLKKLPKSKAIISVHQDTDNTHAHIWIDARQIDGKKVNLRGQEFATFDEDWAKQFDAKYGTSYTAEYKEKKKLSKQWKKDKVAIQRHNAMVESNELILEIPSKPSHMDKFQDTYWKNKEINELGEFDESVGGKRGEIKNEQKAFRRSNRSVETENNTFAEPKGLRVEPNQGKVVFDGNPDDSDHFSTSENIRDGESRIGLGRDNSLGEDEQSADDEIYCHDIEWHQHSTDGNENPRLFDTEFSGSRFSGNREHHELDDRFQTDISAISRFTPRQLFETELIKPLNFKFEKVELIESQSIGIGKMLGDQLLKELEIKQSQFEKVTFKQECEDLIVAVTNIDKTETETSITKLNKKAASVAFKKVAVAEQQGVVRLKVYQTEFNAYEIKAEIRDRFYDETVKGQRKVRSQIWEQHKTKADSTDVHISKLKTELSEIKIQIDKAFKQTDISDTNRDKMIPKIVAEDLWVEQDKAILRGDPESFIILEELHQKSGKTRSNSAVAKLKAKTLVAEKKAELVDYRSNKQETNTKDYIVSINISNGLVTVKSKVKNSEKEEENNTQQRSNEITNRGYRPSFKFIENDFNQMSDSKEYSSLFSDQKKSSSQNLNPFEIMKDDPRVQFIREMFNLVKSHRDSEISENESGMTPALDSKTNTFSLNLRKVAELSTKSLVDEKILRSKTIEMLKTHQLFKAEELAIPLPSFSYDEMKGVLDGATEMRDVDFMKRVLKLSKTNPSIAEEIGTSMERQIAQAIIVKVEATAEIVNSAQFSSRSDFIELRIPDNAIANIESQLNISDEAGRWLDDLNSNNQNLKPEFSEQELERYDQIKSYITEPLRNTVDSFVVDQVGNIVTEAQLPTAPRPRWDDDLSRRLQELSQQQNELFSDRSSLIKVYGKEFVDNDDSKQSDRNHISNTQITKIASTKTEVVVKDKVKETEPVSHSPEIEDLEL